MILEARRAMPDSVHDNWVYAEAVDLDRCRVVLHTYYPHVVPHEFTDIVFDGVVVHHFEERRVGDGRILERPWNVLFDAEEVEPTAILGQYADLMARTQKYAWPVAKYNGLDDLASQLTSGGARCFWVNGTYGLTGFVFATSMEFRSRQSRAEVTSL